MPATPTSRIITALVVGFVIFVIAVYLPKVIITGVIGSVAVTQALELTLSIIAIAVLGRARFTEYGFRRPQREYLAGTNMPHVVTVAVAALALGMAATIVAMVSGGAGNPIAGKMSFPQIILFVLILSSIIEEIFTRGFIQSHIARVTNSSIRLIFFRVELPVLIGALAFSAMHLVLLRRGVDAATLIILLLFTFSVGLLAGTERSRSASLIPAVGVHMVANVGGMVGGIVYAIISVLSGHGLPSP
jgi:membrane protease YdiL (CAAX protease family)